MTTLRFLGWALGGAAGLLTAALAGAATWRTVSGESFEGELSGVFGSRVVFAMPKGTMMITADALDDAGIERVTDFLEAKKAAPAWKDSTSKVATALRGKLVKAQGKALVPFTPGAEPEPELYLVFFGANNSPTERALPELMERYRKAKAGPHSARFDVIFHTRDGGKKPHTEFITKHAMPWPCVSFEAVRKVEVIERWAGRSTPSFIVINPQGDVVIDSEDRDAEGHLMDPVKLWDRFFEVIELIDSHSPAVKRGMHRVALLQYLRTHTTGDRAPQPYALMLDRDRYQTVEPKQFTAKIEIDAQGRVTGASFTPSLGAVVEDQLGKDLLAWRFLPAMKDGKPVPITVNLPVNF